MDKLPRTLLPRGQFPHGRRPVVSEMDQKGRRKRHPLNREADRRLEAIADIIQPLAGLLGKHCEIVLHDYRVPDRSVVAVVGKVTGRRVGSAMSEASLSVLAEKRAAQDRLNYLAKAANGRVINSSTIVLRDANRRVFGALRINLDVTRALDVRGVFNLNRAAGQVAAVLGVSWATANARLQAIREAAVGAARTGGPRRGGRSAADRSR
jgi:predicted transcriptional regulator YheO